MGIYIFVITKSTVQYSASSGVVPTADEFSECAEYRNSLCGRTIACLRGFSHINSISSLLAFDIPTTRRFGFTFVAS